VLVLVVCLDYFAVSGRVEELVLVKYGGTCSASLIYIELKIIDLAD